MFCNELVFGGEIGYLKPFENEEFGGTIEIRGFSKRKGNGYNTPSSIRVFVDKDNWEYLVAKNAKKFDEIEVSAHIETWIRCTSDGNPNPNKRKEVKVIDSILYFNSKD